MGPNSNSFSGLMPIKTIDGIVYVDFAEIIRFEADKKHTLIYVKDKEKAIRSILPFSVIEEMLPPSFFFKCHRSHIISLRHLKKMEKGTRIIQMTDNRSLTIAENRMSEFLQRTDPYYKKKK